MRHVLRQTFEYISAKKWSKELVNELNQIVLENPLNINNESCPDGEYQLFMISFKTSSWNCSQIKLEMLL